MNDSWELVPPPKSQNLIGVKWIYKLKHNSDVVFLNITPNWWLRAMFRRKGLIMKKILHLLP